MSFRSASFIAALVLSLTSAANAAPVLIGFEGSGVAPNGVLSPILPWVESGFTVGHGSPGPESGIFGKDIEGVPNSGSDFLGWSFNGNIVVEQVSGEAFTLNSVDLGHIGAIGGEGDPLTLQVTGNLQGGGTVVTNLVYTNPWATFVLPGTFTNLTSVEFLTGFDGGAGMDNIRVNTAVPEGGPLLPLALSSIFLLVQRARRRIA